MIYLFIHQNFPGQYLHLARYLAHQPENTVYFVTLPNGNEIAGVQKLNYEKVRPAAGSCHSFTVEVDVAVRTGLAVADKCRGLRDRGIQPDIIVGHAGWGETLFVKDVFPDVPLLVNFEFYYHAHGVDVDFDPEFHSDFHHPSHLRVRNATALMAYDAADWGHSATQWQLKLHPPELRSRISVLHEGVDTNAVRPDSKATFFLEKEGRLLTRSDEVITYVARNLEPYRGFHVFMRALPEILRRRPKAQVVLVGGDGVSYGTPAPPMSTFRETLIAELGDQVDWSRIHFLGIQDYKSYLNLLQVSSVHVYLTYPFVLSWSFIEAMASGCLVIGSSTPPVLEVLKDGVNGLTVDFFGISELADRIDEVLNDPSRMANLRKAARQTAIDQFDLKSRTLPSWLRLFEDLIAGRRPAALL